MIKKTITYTDYNGVERTEEAFFNLNEAEVTELELGVTGGWSEMAKKIIETKDLPSLIKIFKELLFKSYGVKSPDGRRFIKSQELSIEFSQTEAYSKLFMELATDDVAAAEFCNQVLPTKIQEAAKAKEQAATDAGKMIEIK